jgi:hypothetical protein
MNSITESKYPLLNYTHTSYTTDKSSFGKTEISSVLMTRLTVLRMFLPCLVLLILNEIVILKYRKYLANERYLKRLKSSKSFD